MLRRDITPEEFVRAARMCAGPFAPWTDKAAADTEAVRALFETEPRECGVCGELIDSECICAVENTPTPPAGSEEPPKRFQAYRDKAASLLYDASRMVDALLDERDALRADLERVTRAIRWALGEGDSDFAEEMERATDPEKGRAPFWWRTKLRRLAGLDAARTAEAPKRFVSGEQVMRHYGATPPTGTHPITSEHLHLEEPVVEHPHFNEPTPPAGSEEVYWPVCIECRTRFQATHADADICHECNEKIEASPTPPAGSEEQPASYWKGLADEWERDNLRLERENDALRRDYAALRAECATLNEVAKANGALARSLRADLERLKGEKVPLEACKQVLLAMHKSLGIQWGDDPYRAIDALRQDKARLDWLSNILQGKTPEGEATIGDIDLRGSWKMVGLLVPHMDYATGATLRDAIDAARTAGEGRDG